MNMQTPPVLSRNDALPSRSVCAFCLPAIDVVTHHALSTLDAALERDGHDIDLRQSVQIVIGETLNNICEHAYAGHVLGAYALRAHVTRAPLLIVDLQDWGACLPGMRLPGDDAPAPTDMAEGGYGWSMIHMLTQAVTYKRQLGCNRLSLSFELA